MNTKTICIGIDKEIHLDPLPSGEISLAIKQRSIHRWLDESLGIYRDVNGFSELERIQLSEDEAMKLGVALIITQGEDACLAH
jgi:hypothetical protein